MTPPELPATIARLALAAALVTLAATAALLASRLARDPAITGALQGFALLLYFIAAAGFILGTIEAHLTARRAKRHDCLRPTDDPTDPDPPWCTKHAPRTPPDEQHCKAKPRPKEAHR